MKRVRPFLKWAGGKYAILDRVLAALPPAEPRQRLVEPFVGAGSVFLNTNYDRYLLGEANLDLINLYQQLQRDSNGFIRYAARYFKPELNQSDQYYVYRDKFNVSSNARQRAGLFLYLNRHGFNGLCRYNQSGGYNVPFGQVRPPQYPKLALECFAEQLQSATLFASDFRETLAQAKSGDVVYCDPPYVPLSDSAYFTHYYVQDFSHADQQALAIAAKQLAKRGIPVVISNHDTPVTRKLYRGAKIVTFPVPRRIAANHQSRQPVSELIAVFA